MIRHRVRFDYTGRKGSASPLPKGHPPWLVSGIPTHLGKDQRWFYSLEAALVWAQGEMAMKTTRSLE
ncbi:MAG: hypothetical protein U1E51_06850 [Candidatus Binatia bacterium]|nr:hypothetical protein [Candidatus Binatia bacterium]